ncbi:MAG: PfkB family carbohydrate kinase [Gammaproteobacteria bacterium]|nr:PfkB family carbohydrate kinase [Gammaproteobacteria bacterium]
MTSAKVLVIGSAHLDILAEFDDTNQENAVDKIGSGVNFGIGGTAINIAAWLQELEHKPYLLTAINKASFTGQAVLNALRAGRLSPKYILDDPKLRDSAFVAAVSNKRLHSAISCMGVAESRRLIGRLEATIPQFHWVVFDCNLSRGAIEKIAEICRRRHIHAVGAATSDTKATRLTVTRPYGTRALCMNRHEANALTKELGLPDGELRELRTALNTKTLLVTAGDEGWHLAEEDDVTKYKGPEGIVPETDIGAGDAACAGLVHALAQGESIQDTVNGMAGDALRSRLPTSFAERISADALRKFVRNRRKYRIILGVLGIVAVATLGWFVEKILEWLLTQIEMS